MGSIISAIKAFVDCINSFMGKGIVAEATNNDLSASILSSTGPIYQVCTSVIIPIGISLCLLYFLLEMLEEATRDNFTIEHIVKGMIKLCLGVMLIQNLLPTKDSDGILLGITGFATSLCTSLTEVNWTGKLILDVEGKSIFTIMGQIMQLINEPIVPYVLMYLLRYQWLIFFIGD